MADDLASNNLLLTIQYLFLSERTPLEGFKFYVLSCCTTIEHYLRRSFQVHFNVQQMRRPDFFGILQQGYSANQN